MTTGFEREWNNRDSTGLSFKFDGTNLVLQENKECLLSKAKISGMAILWPLAVTEELQKRSTITMTTS